jgi:hypothetical protein
MGIKLRYFQSCFLFIVLINFTKTEAKGFRKIPKKEDKQNDFWSKDYRPNNLNPFDPGSRLYSMLFHPIFFTIYTIFFSNL